MRKLIFSFFILLAILILAAVFFLKRFDADRFRPRLVQELERVTGNPVKLGKLSLTWHGGLALELDGLEVFQRGSSTDMPVIRLEKGGAVLQLLPLLQKQIKLASLDFRKPQLEIIRSKQGAVQISGLNPQPQPSDPAEEKPQGSAAALPVSFFIGNISVKDGQVIFRDEMSAPPTVIPVRDLNVSLKDMSLEPDGKLRFNLDLHAAVLSSEKNLEFSGKVLCQIPGGIFELGLARGEFDLGSLEIKTLEENVPAFKALTFQEQFAGKIKMNVDRLVVTPEGIGDIESQMIVSGGRFRTDSLAVPVEEIDIKAAIDAEKVSVESLTARLAGGTAKFSGGVADWRGKGLSELKADIQNIALENFMPPVSAKEPQLHGRVGLSFEGNASGLGYPDFSRSLAGEGKFSLKDGVIVNFSVLRNVLDKLSMFPGLSGQIEASIPENLKAKFQKSDTVFEAMEQPYQIREGRVTVPDLDFKTDTFESKGSVDFALTGEVRGKMAFSMALDLSEAVIKELPKMKYLADSGGSVVFPVVFQGTAPKILLVPDLKEISGRLAARAAEDLISGKILKKTPAEGAEKQGSDLAMFDNFIKAAEQAVTKPKVPAAEETPSA